MALVKMKEKFQLTVPSELRRRVKYAVGDLFDANVEADGLITFRAKTLVDRHIADGLADVRAGRVEGPFDSVDDMLSSLGHKRKRR